MEFCPKCKSIMVPEKGVVTCRTCGFSKAKLNLARTRHVHEIARNTRNILVIEGESDEGKPTIKAHCSECGNDKAYWWLRQLRSADESEVRFFRCTKCGKTWREYD
ncbi:MAG TPA: transcription factor S [Candidatus Bathyarchaeia archaeon]|nr:transcription factor S [Candidatus Bathyarchaeia archaeon]